MGRVDGQTDGWSNKHEQIPRGEDAKNREF